MVSPWAKLVRIFERKRGSCDVTYRTLVLGNRDAETGWRAKSYTESTKKAILVARGDTHTALPSGTYVRSDWLILLPPDLSPKAYDQLKTAGNVYFELEAVRERMLTPDTVEYHEVDVSKLPFAPEPEAPAGYPYTYPHAYA